MRESLEWIGAAVHGPTNWPALDFANTIEWRLSDRHEFLRDYADVVMWARHDALIDDADARRLLAAAAADSIAAAAAHEAVIRLRESLYALFSAIAAGAAVPAASLDALNAALVTAAVPERVTVTPEGFVRKHIEPADDLTWPLNPVVRSAANLLTAPELDRLKECPGGPNRACGFLFLDQTKNRSRRWCSGRTCGNRVRLYRHYASRLSETSPEAG